jgi:RimJ/RimL family protein N-acetyltransferase
MNKVTSDRETARIRYAPRVTPWQRELPVLRDVRTTLRELERRDAASLLRHLADEPVLRHMAQSPTSLDGFRAFIRWTRAQRRKGTLVTYGLVPAGESSAVGLLQLWPVAPNFSISEWGFAVGEQYWGTGLFASGARLLLDFAFAGLGVARLEARSVDANARGNAALMKLGAKPEGRLRSAFRCGKTAVDYVMWSILAEEWAATRGRARVAS